MKHRQRTIRPPGMFLLLGVVFLVMASGGRSIAAQQQFWEGRISTAPYGLLPLSGLYAASNAFPMDTKVVITHPGDGSKIEVRVVARLDQDRVFMQVSTDTADRLGLKKNEILTVRISPLESKNGVLERQLAAETPYSRDPDMNPSAGIEEERLSLIEEYLAAEAERRQAPVAVDGGTVGSETAVPPLPSETEAPLPTREEPPLGQLTEAVPDTESVLMSVESIPERSPAEKKISITLPPPEKLETPVGKEDVGGTVETATGESFDLPKVVSIEPVFLREKDRSYSPLAPSLPDRVTRAEARAAGPRASLEMIRPLSAEEPAVYTLRHFPEPPGLEAPSVDLRIAGRVETGPEEILPVHSPMVEDGEEPPKAPLAEIPEEAELVLLPAEERPPGKPGGAGDEVSGKGAEAPGAILAEKAASDPVRQARAEEDRRTGSFPVKIDLEKSSYYLQVAAYGKLEPAQERAADLAVYYPVTIYSEKGGPSGPYRLMIGPLNEDESGTLLYTFTSRGYPDAFIRRGN